MGWSPDGRYLAVGHNTTPYVTIYLMMGRSITKIADPEDLPTGIGHAVGWSPDGRHLAVGHNTDPYVTIYDLRGSAGKEWLVEIDTAAGRVAGAQSALEYRFA